MVEWQFQPAASEASTLLGADNSNNAQATTNVVGNEDGSIVERIEFIQALLAGTVGLATFPAGALAANNVSLAEVIRAIQENIIVGTGTALPSNQSIYDLLAGANGIATWAAAAAPANGVSIAEAIRYIVESQLAVQTADSTANVDAADVIGNKTDAAVTTVGTTVSLAAYTKGILNDMLALPRCVEKADGAVLSGADPLFTITGGPIKLLEITGIVTTSIGAGTTNAKLQVVTTTPSATVDMNAAAVDIDADAAGTSYQTINTTGILTPVTAGYVKEANSFATLPTTFIIPIGSIQFTSDAARTGNIKWYLRYVPLSPLSRVTAAA